MNFIVSQFSNCTLILIFHSRNLNNKINWIHERALRLVDQNNMSFSELFDRNNSVKVLNKNFQTFVTQIYAVKN